MILRGDSEHSKDKIGKSKTAQKRIAIKIAIKMISNNIYLKTYKKNSFRKI